MSFCAYCGKQLEEGQVCGCPESAVAAQPVQPQNYVNPQLNQGTYSQAYQQNPNQGAGQMSGEASQAVAAVSQAASKTGNVLTEALGYLILILKEPVKAGNRFIVSANIKVACLLILFQGVLSSLFSLIVAGKINSLISKVGATANAITGLTGSGGIAINDVISSGKAFFLTLLMSIIFSLIYALLTWAVVAISKGKTTYQQMISAAGVRSAVTMAVTGASIVLFVINTFVGIGVFFIVGLFFSVVVLAESLNAVEGINQNSKVYFVPIAITVFCILTAYLTIRIAPQAISDYYLRLIKTISDWKSILGLLNL